MAKVIIKFKGQTVDCYGEMSEGQNISVVCDNELEDIIWPTGYKNWKTAVQALINSNNFQSDFIELEAV